MTTKATLTDWRRAAKMRAEGYTIQAIADVEGKGLATVQRWLIKAEEIDGPLTTPDGELLKPCPGDMNALKGYALRSAYIVLLDLMEHGGDPLKLKAAQIIVSDQSKTQDESGDKESSSPAASENISQKEIRELLETLPQEWLTAALLN